MFICLFCLFYINWMLSCLWSNNNQEAVLNSILNNINIKTKCETLIIDKREANGKI